MGLGQVYILTLPLTNTPTLHWTHAYYLTHIQGLCSIGSVTNMHDNDNNNNKSLNLLSSLLHDRHQATTTNFFESSSNLVGRIFFFLDRISLCSQGWP